MCSRFTCYPTRVVRSCWRYVKVCNSSMVSIIKWKVLCITEDVYSFQCHSDSEVACCFAPLFYSSGDHAACRFRRVVEPCAAESNFRAFWPWAAWSKHAASQGNATSNVQACRICLVSSSEFGRMWSAFLWVWSQQPGEIVRRNHDLWQIQSHFIPLKSKMLRPRWM